MTQHVPSYQQSTPHQQPAPYQQPGPTYPSPAAADVSSLSRQFATAPQAFLSGDWAGAASAVVIGLAAMLGLALLAGLLGDTSTGSTDASELIGSVAILVAMAAGGSLSASSGAVGIDLSFRPLSLTFLGFTLIAVLFVRRLRRRGTTTAMAVGLQACRLAVILAAGMLIVSLISRTGSGSSEVKVDAFSAMFFGVVTLAIALVPAVVLGLPGVLPPRFEAYRLRVAGPVRGVLVLTATTCAATMIAVLLYTLSWASDFGDGAEMGPFWRGIAAALLLMLPNLAGAGLLFGIGVPAKGSMGMSFGLDSTSSSGTVSILDAVDTDGRFWIWPLVIAVLIVMAGVVAARRSPVGPGGRPMVLWFAAVMSISLFVLSLTLSASAGGSLFFSGSIGFDYLLTIVFGGIVGLLGGLAGAAFIRRTVAPAPTAPPVLPPPPATYPPA
jgi:hypothetical protein